MGPPRSLWAINKYNLWKYIFKNEYEVESKIRKIKSINTCISPVNFFKNSML